MRREAVNACTVCGTVTAKECLQNVMANASHKELDLSSNAVYKRLQFFLDADTHCNCHCYVDTEISRHYFTE